MVELLSAAPWRRLDRAGVTSIEYAVVCSAVAMVVIGGYRYLGSGVFSLMVARIVSLF